MSWYNDPFQIWILSLLKEKEEKGEIATVHVILASTENLSIGDILELEQAGFVEVKYPDLFSKSNKIPHADTVVRLTASGLKALRLGF